MPTQHLMKIKIGGVEYTGEIEELAKIHKLTPMQIIMNGTAVSPEIYTRKIPKIRKSRLEDKIEYHRKKLEEYENELKGREFSKKLASKPE